MSICDDDTHLQPLLDRSDAHEIPPNDNEVHTVPKRDKVKSKVVLLCIVVAVLVLMVHIMFVALLIKTIVTLEQLTLPDLCHYETVGEVILEFQNPSYCSPIVGPLDIRFTKKSTTFLHVHVAAFELQSGLTTVVSPVHFTLLKSPQDLYQFVLAEDGENTHVHGQVPVSISCMLVPFTIHLDVSDLLKANTQPPVTTLVPPNWRYTLGLPMDSAGTGASGIVNKIMTELQHVVKQVLKTIALSHFHTEEDKQEVFAYTDVSIEYASRVLWNLPSLSIEVQSIERQTILVAGLKRFLLGSGQTFISAFTEVFKNQTDPILSMLQSYLSGNDVELHVRGGNADTECYSLQVLDLVDVQVSVPAKIDNEPAFLREYSIKPMLKEMDSKSHVCYLDLTVSIRINNPLPMQLDLYGIKLDLLYENDSFKNSSSSKFLLHVNNTMHVSWIAHEENTIVLKTAVHDFNSCVEVVTFYLHNQLSFDIQHGRASLGSDLGNFSIPFSVKDIHIKPSQSAKNTSHVRATSDANQQHYNMGASFSRYLCLAVGVAYPAYASFKALERPHTGHDSKQWLTYWIVYGATTSVETVASPLVCLVPGYNMTKTLFLIWMMSRQTHGATIVYDKLLCPFLKQKESFVDRKLEEAQEAAEGVLSSFVRAWGQTITDQVVAIQKSDEFKQICLAIKALASPDSIEERRKEKSID